MRLNPRGSSGWAAVGLLALALVAGCLRGSASAAVLPAAAGLIVPAGFRAEIYAQGLDGPRFMAIAPNGDVLVAQTDAGNVVALHGPASAPVVVASGLSRPHGLAFDGAVLYIAGWSGVDKMNYPGGTLHHVVGGFPENAQHNRRALAIAQDGSLFVSLGSSCNVCDDAPRLATIQHVAGGVATTYATGLRIASGLAFDGSGRLWATNNQRDNIASTPAGNDNLPPDELDQVLAGDDFGWPRCYADPVLPKRHANPEYAGADCTKTKPAALAFPAHSSPLGIIFYRKTQFPAAYRGGAFVAFHGSWNRSARTGDKVVYVRFANGQPSSVADFVTGWLVNGRYSGRPVGLAVSADGALYISDDQGGTIYRITYTPN